MSHRNEQRLRDAYAAFARGDLAGYLSHCTDGIVFHVPGKGRMAGDWTRAQFTGPFIERLMSETQGSFKEVVTDVVANDTRGVVMAEHELTRLGRTFRYRTIHVYRIEDGKLADFREVPEDLYAFDEAWR